MGPISVNYTLYPVLLFCIGLQPTFHEDMIVMTSPITNTVGISNHYTDGKDNLGPSRKEK